MVKLQKFGKIIRYFFPGKMAAEKNLKVSDFGGFAWSGFYRFLHGSVNVHAHWLALVSLVIGFLGALFAFFVSFFRGQRPCIGPIRKWGMDFGLGRPAGVTPR